MLQPTGKNILVIENEYPTEKTTASGILIALPKAEEKVNKIGKVYACGKAVTEVKAGDEIMFNWSETIEHEDKKYELIKEDTIICILK